MTGGGLATRHPLRLTADPSRVITQLFVPGLNLPGPHHERVSGVVEHVLALDDDEVAEALAGILLRFDDRHRELTATFKHHADRIANRLERGVELSDERLLLLGATFTHEYSVEAAALCNPSVVASPDQSGTPDGSLRFVMSVRQIGEGHRSSIGFRSGLVDRRGGVSIDASSPFTTAGAVSASMLDADAFRCLDRRLHDAAESTDWVLDGLDRRFTVGQLEARLAELEAQHDTRRNVAETIGRLRELALRTYSVSFPPSSGLTERVLYPATAVESNGIEDARFVRFVGDDGEVTFYATATAFDGSAIRQQLIATDDFLTFEASPLLGAATDNKGLALFPRRIGGRFAALSRHDGATNGIAFSDTVGHWPTVARLDSRTAAWEAVQVGNCGSPIETEAGWLVLTHGVGPMRTYSIGAWLLDLDDPTRLLGRVHEPVLTPLAEEQDGYVPNVVYSCGSLLHGETVLIPYGIGDSSISVATVPVDDLLGAMVPTRR